VDKSSYQQKVLTLLSERNTYLRLDNDPTAKQQRTLNSKLAALKRTGILAVQDYHWLYRNKGAAPRLYGPPKIHKKDVPLRPIVSFVNAPSERTSRYLTRIISKLVGKTETTVRNCSEFVQRFKNITIREEEVMVSFDVVSSQMFQRIWRSKWHGNASMSRMTEKRPPQTVG